MEKVEISEDIVRFVEDLISSGEEKFEVIKLRVLDEESEQHDDELIDSVIHDFTIVLQGLASDLAGWYGEPRIALDEEEFDDETEEQGEEEGEPFYVPCSFSSAIWETEELILYLAVCQEDREFPIMLVVGVEY
ncbi:hypothetical protein L1077_20565 [Pseudoalteromonas luteoviolacea]|uniref:hypothetical protein n=1 Tax=Pseudoalteromonas luteoviolacea TaxID=43657 RepID=UPI001F29EFCE|nr:hypothetical protein [Pseudoalteromonas luteoviolacea]MCF6441834.1 hypothetical protein [Pseudoalteromonas luteoviolacea]